MATGRHSTERVTLVRLVMGGRIIPAAADGADWYGEFERQYAESVAGGRRKCTAYTGVLDALSPISDPRSRAP